MTKEEEIKILREAYDNALFSVRTALATLIPELKESEDERIKRELCNDLLLYVPTPERYIAWLEKQSEQKPAAEVKPKFKVGDWITNGEYTWKVTGIGQLDYILQSQNGDTVDDNISYVNQHFHRWTIQYAKDGDVLYHKSTLTGTEYIVMSRGVNDCGNIDSYFRYNSEYGFGIDIPSVFSTKLDDITPATKAQRNLLFQKMHEAGYEWDAEKKKLRKIEQKPAWNGEDEAGFGNALWAIKQARSIAKDGNDMGNLWYAERWLKSIKDRVKPQPKQEWSEEDKKKQNAIIGILDFQANKAPDRCCATDGFLLDELIDWLKSLKPQKHWKPSEEHMKALHDLNLTGNISYAGQGQVLIELYNDLKKLK